jgi:hypothetical protein
LQCDFRHEFEISCSRFLLRIPWFEKFLETCELKPWVWWRFLDDIFVIWLHSEEELNYFLLRLNSFHENIKYTWDISYHRISFLDVSVGLDNGVFSTDVYSKPTDAHQYLNFKSCHPPHVKRGILMDRRCV